MNDGELDMRVTHVAAPVRHQLVDTLRRAILELRFRPGDRLVERELCELTGVSRTSLREALRQLESEGLVSIIPNRGPIVATVDREEAEQIYDLRAVLEGFMGRRFAERATDKQIKRLREALEAFRKAVKRGDARDLISTKSEFYDQLMTGSGNRALEGALRNLHGRVTLLRATSMGQPGRIAVSLRELEGIVDAIARRDPVAAERACIEHVHNASKIVLEVLEDGDWAKRPKP
jgi:GntR family transcriptional regulator, trigonelline degradation regulator